MRQFLAGIFLLLWPVAAIADDFVVIVFDNSGSMGTKMAGGQTRMQTAQTALGGVLSQIPETTNVGIVTSARPKTPKLEIKSQTFWYKTACIDL